MFFNFNKHVEYNLGRRVGVFWWSRPLTLLSGMGTLGQAAVEGVFKMSFHQNQSFLWKSLDQKDIDTILCALF